MHRKPLVNESTKGLSIFLRCVLITAEILILAFVYALCQISGALGFAFALIGLCAATFIIYIFEKTLYEDGIIRQGHQERQAFSLWRFVRLVFVGAGFWVIVSSLWEKIQ